MKKKFNLQIENIKDDSDEGGWVSYDLIAEGDSLQEMWKDATYFLTDQDGGSVKDMDADDKTALEAIENFFESLTEEELINGKNEAR